MSGTRDRAKHYCDRANECLQILATSHTPGTGEIYLQIAEHYLLLATSQKRHRAGPAIARSTRASQSELVA